MRSQYRKKLLYLTLLFCVATTSYISFYNIDTWLDQSTTPIYSNAIVCLSYDPMRIKKAILLLKQGYGKKIIATTKLSYARLLKEHIQPEQIILLPSSGTNTYKEVLSLKNYLQQHSYNKIIIVSTPYHLYRVRWTFMHLFKNTDYLFTYVSSTSRESLGFWWNNPHSRKAVLRELPSIVYYWVGYGFLGLQENPVWVNKIKSQYLAFLNKLF